MGDRDDSVPRSLPGIIYDPPARELRLHREFIHRHIDFLIDILTAEQYHNQWRQPAGCPSATPERVARNRKRGGQFPCRYSHLTAFPEESADENACTCGDPLAESDDPLDTVAATAIARDDRTPGERYFDIEERRLITKLRENVGSWEAIYALERAELRDELVRVSTRDGIGEWRVTRLYDLLESVQDCSRTEGITLNGIGRIPYRSYREMLQGFPGISESDTWWLLLGAFDKPIWPADPHIDRLLSLFGFIDPGDIDSGSAHRQQLADDLTDRHVSALHRALAGHALKGHDPHDDRACAIRKFLLTYRLQRQSAHPEDASVIDLFSGAGGLSLGFTRAGYAIDWAIDNDRHATDTYRLNHPEVPHRDVACEDIGDIAGDDITDRLSHGPDVVIGGPPCQALSLAGYRSRLSDVDDYSIIDDERTVLYERFVEIIEALRPKALVMENVDGMMSTIGDTGFRVGDLVIDSLESIGDSGQGYVCDYQLINCTEIGIPQDRDRVIIIGIREDLATANDTVEDLFTRIRDSHSGPDRTLRQALSGIPKIRRGEGGRVVAGRTRGRWSDFVRESDLVNRTGLCFNHQAREHPMEKDRLLFDEAMEPGDTSWDVKYSKTDYSHLIEYDVGTEDDPRFKDKYRMLCWDEPAPTVVAHLAKDANNFIIPDYHGHVPQSCGEPDDRRNRGITAREAARLQTFPDDHIFLGPFGSWFRQIGNAVPPVLGERIGTVLLEFLDETTIHASERVSGPVGQASGDD